MAMWLKVENVLPSFPSRTRVGTLNWCSCDPLLDSVLSSELSQVKVQSQEVLSLCKEISAAEQLTISVWSLRRSRGSSSNPVNFFCQISSQITIPFFFSLKFKSLSARMFLSTRALDFSQPLLPSTLVISFSFRNLPPYEEYFIKKISRLQIHEVNAKS